MDSGTGMNNCKFLHQNINVNAIVTATWQPLECSGIGYCLRRVAVLVKYDVF